MTQPWWFLRSPPAPAAYNMAVDETLLRFAARRAQPLLRLYCWSEPAVTFGYFQKFPHHIADTHTVIRRPTGGGIVYHTADTTYSVVAPPGHPLHQMPTPEAYRLLHRAVALALNRQSQLCNRPVPLRGSYECFQNPVAGDVIAPDGTKLAGAAQRRSRLGLLHQGSIAIKVSAEDLTRGFRDVLDAEFADYTLRPDELALAERLAREKYGTESWNRRIA